VGTLGPGPHKQRAASGTLAPLSAQNELIGVYSGTATTVNMLFGIPAFTEHAPHGTFISPIGTICSIECRQGRQAT